MLEPGDGIEPPMYSPPTPRWGIFSGLDGPRPCQRSYPALAPRTGIEPVLIPDLWDCST